MLALGPLLFAAAQCLVPEGPALARLHTPDGVAVVARAGALEIGARTITFCDGLPDANPTALAWWRDQLVVGFRAGGAYTWDGARFTAVRGLPRDGVRALAARSDELWVGTGTAGLWHSDGKATQRSRHPVLGRREISALFTARDGVLHVGAGPYGWWRVDGAGQARYFRGVYAGCFVESRAGVSARLPGPACTPPARATASGLPSSHITALVTHAGALWVGTFANGLSRQREGGRFTQIADLPPFINALYEDGRALYVGTPKGLYRVSDGDRVERVTFGLGDEHINGLAGGAHGMLWVATGQGLVGVGPDGVRLLDERGGLPSHLVYAVTETADGAVWAGTAAGVARVTEIGVQLYSRASGALPHDWVTALLPDGNDVLAGTYDAGVAHLFSDGRGRPTPGLDSAWVNPNGLYRLDDGVAVLTLGGGLLFSDGNRVATMRLPSDDVTALASLGADIWVGTRAGLVRAR